MKYVHAKIVNDAWDCWDIPHLVPENVWGRPLLSSSLIPAGFRDGDDVVILDAKEFYRLIDGLDRTAE